MLHPGVAGHFPAGGGAGRAPPKLYTTPRTWHAHIYDRPPKAPTPHLISDILGLGDRGDAPLDCRASGGGRGVGRRSPDSGRSSPDDLRSPPPAYPPLHHAPTNGHSPPPVYHNGLPRPRTTMADQLRAGLEDQEGCCRGRDDSDGGYSRAPSRADTDSPVDVTTDDSTSTLDGKLWCDCPLLCPLCSNRSRQTLYPLLTLSRTFFP